MTAPAPRPRRHPRWGKTRDGLAVHAHVHDYLPTATGMQRANAWLAIRITKGIGTMWAAYAFALFDLLALPTAIRGGLYGIVQWVASFFLQLVLLSIIMVGQDVQARASDARAAKTFEDCEAIIGQLAEVLAAVGEARKDFAMTVHAVTRATGGSNDQH
jgi:hypothetical protein